MSSLFFNGPTPTFLFFFFVERDFQKFIKILTGKNVLHLHIFVKIQNFYHLCLRVWLCQTLKEQTWLSQMNYKDLWQRCGTTRLARVLHNLMS